MKSLKKIDLFGHTMTLNFNQKGRTHTTYIGGFCSIFLYAFFIFFISRKSLQLLNREEDKLGIMDVNAKDVNVRMDIVWAHQVNIYSKTNSREYSVVTDDEDSRKFVDFNYYYRVIDWYADLTVDNYYTYVPIGKKELTVENIGPDFYEQYMTSYDGIGPFYIPEIDTADIELQDNMDAWQSRQIVFGITRCAFDCASPADIDDYIERLQIDGYSFQHKIDFLIYDEKPIIIDVKYYQQVLRKDALTETNIKLRRNVLETTDNRFYSFNPTVYNF